MFNASNLLFFLLIVSLLVISIGWMFLGDMPMFKKRYLPSLVLVLLLFAIGALVGIKKVTALRNELPEMIEICRDALSSAGYVPSADHVVWECQKGKKFYTTVQYQRTKFSSLDTARVYFTDEVNDMWCDMQQPGSTWVVTHMGSTMAWPCP